MSNRIVVNPSMLLDINVVPSGIPGIKTFEIYQTFPMVQTVRAQRILQLSLPRSQMLEIANLINCGYRGAE